VKFSTIKTLKNLDILDTILSKIKEYLSKKIDTIELIQSLENLLDHLSIVDSEWKIEFRGYWSDIEVSYALTLNQNEELGNYDKENHQAIGDFDKEKFAVINSALANLSRMTSTKIKDTENILSKYLDTPDAAILESAAELDNNWLMCPKCIDAWQSSSNKALVLCPKCNHAFQNPRYRSTK